MRMRTAIPVVVLLVLTVGLTSCAQQPTQSSAEPRAHPTGPDFSRDDAANFAAAQLAQQLLADLTSLPGYAGLRIVSYGIEVDVVGKPSPAMHAAVERDTQRYQGNVIPVRYRKVRYTEKELKALQDQITADRNEWLTQGIELTTWGVDVPSNTVQIGLATYKLGYRAALLARYGDRISVTPYDVRPAAL
jgi:hypothetical protein